MDNQTRVSATDEELERALRAHRRALARARMRRITSDLYDEAGAVDVAPELAATRLTPAEQRQPQGEKALSAARSAPAAPQTVAKPLRPPATALDRVLLIVEILAVAGVVCAAFFSLNDLRRLRRDLSGPAPTAPPTVPHPPPSPPGGGLRGVRGIEGGVPAPVVWVEPTATVTPSPTSTTTATATAAPSATEALLPAAPSTPTEAATVTAAPLQRTATATMPPVPTGTPDSPTGVRFVIPAIGVDAPMVEGDDWETLKTGIGHRIGSPYPGENGNVVVSAHNDVYGAIFKNLRELQPGDPVYAYTSTGTFRYEVVFTRLVLPTEVSVLNPTRQPILTMITCYPPFMDTHRIVVTAKLVK